MSEPTVSCNVSNCPTCDSPGKHLHPAVQHEGEVQICGDPWHTPMPPHALTREQVEGLMIGLRARDYGEGQVKLLEDNDTTLRQALTQQAQEIEQRDVLIDHLETSKTWYQKTIDEQTQEVERLKAALVRMEADRDDARTERNTAVIGNNILRDKLAAMTAERDKWKGYHDQQVLIKRKLHDMYNDVRSQIATLQATLAEREREIAESEGRAATRPACTSESTRSQP